MEARLTNQRSDIKVFSSVVFRIIDVHFNKVKVNVDGYLQNREAAPAIYIWIALIKMDTIYCFSIKLHKSLDFCCPSSKILKLLL